jgi:hypothetical protein
MNIAARFGLALALCLLASVSHAEVHCVIAETLDQCNQKIAKDVNESLSAAKDKEKDALAVGLAKKLTGSAPAATPQGANSFSDFFNTLKAAADSGSTDNKQNDEAIGFEMSHCLRDSFTPAIGSSYRLQCQARVRAGGARLYEPIKKALPDSVRDARSKELESGLSFGDTVSAGVFFNLAGDRVGRVPPFGAHGLFEDIWKVVDSDTETVDVSARDTTAARERLVANAFTVFSTKAPGQTFDPNGELTELARLDAALAEALVKAREAAARAELGSMDRMRSSLRAHHYFDLVDLVNNQPQLNFGVEYTQRNDLAGPDEWRARLVWEYGLVNLNTAQDSVNLCSKSSPDNSKLKMSCLDRYLGNKITQKRLKGGDRLALSIEAVRRKKYSASLPSDNISFTEKPTKSLIGAFSYGFYTAFGDDGDATSRLDFKIDYEDVSDDPRRQDRGTAVGTFSQKVYGSVLALSLVYGTKPEFRGDVNQDLSARLGLNYKWGKPESF